MFDNAGGVAANRIAKYDTLISDWVPVGTGLSINAIGPFDGIYTLCPFNNSLYAGGAFTTQNGLHDIVKWNGSAWSDGATAMSSMAGFGVQTITTYNYHLYAGGLFATPSGYVAELDGVTGTTEIPKESAGLLVYPNPAEIKSNITYHLKESSDVTLEIYSSSGQKVLSLVDHIHQQPGDYNMDIQSEKLSKGVYFVKLISNEQSSTNKLILQ